MSYSDSFPSSSPVFQANFSANGGRIDPRMTFSRADTPPTYAAPSAVHYWSNEKHLSSENLLLDSSTGTANWEGGASGSAATATVTANYAASPDGTANQATRVQLDLSGATDTSSNSRYSQSIDLPSGDSVTFSVWLKSTDGVSSYAIQVYRADGLADAATVTGTWQKFTTTATAAANAGFGIRVRGGQSPTNSDTADVLIWGANVSTTGQTVLSETTTQIHREYAPTLKSVATAGQPRFEYDPSSDGQSVAKGILIEGAATNAISYSDSISNWNEARLTVTDNAAVGPTGSLNASLLTPTSANGTHSTNLGGVATSVTGTVTLSGYFKAAGYDYVTLGIGDTTTTQFAHALFNLSTGDYVANNVSGNSSYVSSSTESVGNGWWRLVATFSTTEANEKFVISPASSGTPSYNANWGVPTYAGDDYSGVLATGLQGEVGKSFASSLITSNSGSETTRVADSLSVATADIGYTGGDFSLVVDATNPAVNGVIVAEVGDGTASNSARLVARVDGTPAFTVVDNGAVQAYIGNTSSRDAKRAIRCANNNFGYCENGGTVSTDTAGVVPVTSTLYIGKYYAGAQLDGHIKRLALYNEALSDTNLQALTS